MKKNRVILSIFVLIFISSILLGTNSNPQTIHSENTKIHTSATSVAYIYQDNITIANDFENLLQDNCFQVTLIPMANVASTNFSSYKVIIIGPGSDGWFGPFSERLAWGTPAQCAAVNNSGKPVLGIHWGGLAFFENLSLFIGSPNQMGGWITELNVTNSSHPIYQTPNLLPTSEHMPILTSTPYYTQSIYNPTPVAGVVRLGNLEGYPNHYSLIMEQSIYFLWGFPSGPSTMTTNGTQLFVNVVAFLSGISELDTCPPGIPGFEIIFTLISIIAVVMVFAKKRILPL